MKDSFDRGIKQKLEDLTPEELGYRPDREKMWEKIAPKKKAKTIPFPSWITHAAAVAAGLLIGAFWLNHHQQDREHEPVVISHTKVQPAQVSVKTDTVYVQHPVVAQQKKAVESVPVATIRKQQPQESFVAQEPFGNKTNKESIPAPAVTPEAIVAAAPPAIQRKVLHLSDMDNENAIPKPKPKNLAFFKMLSNSGQPEDNHATLSMLVGQRLAAAKN